MFRNQFQRAKLPLPLNPVRELTKSSPDSIPRGVEGRPTRLSALCIVLFSRFLSLCPSAPPLSVSRSMS